MLLISSHPIQPWGIDKCIRSWSHEKGPICGVVNKMRKKGKKYQNYNHICSSYYKQITLLGWIK